MLHLALAPLLNGTLFYNNNDARVKCSTVFGNCKNKKHIGAFTLLTKTTKHIFDTNLTIVQRKLRFWGEKNTQIPISVIRGGRGGRSAGAGRVRGAAAAAGAGRRKRKRVNCSWEL
jgi:hypothetical protein